MPLSRVLLGSLCLVAGCSSKANDLDLGTVVANHVEARGGTTSIEAVQAFETEIHIVEPTFEVDGLYVATRDGRMRIDVSVAGERVFTEALDHGGAWSWSPDNGVRKGSAAAAAALRRGVEQPFKLFGLHEMEGRGHRLALMRRESIDGVNYYVLRLTLDDGYEILYYLHPDTWLVGRDRTRRAMHVDIDPTPEWIETVYDDYRPVGGVMYPHRQVERQLDSGSLLSTLTILAIRLNPEIPAGRFLP